MNTHRRRVFLGMGLFALGAIALLFVAAHVLAQRLAPYIREQAVQYLQKRFHSEVELGALNISMSKISPLKLLFSRAHRTLATVEGRDVSLRYAGNSDLPPMFVMKRFSFVVEVGTIFGKPKTVHSVSIDGMEINVPPKGARPHLDSGGEDQPDTGVIIEEVILTNSILRILPQEEDKTPLQFDLRRIRLESAGKNVAMKYDAELTNAKPPGIIQSVGTFGPWAAGEPGNTPLAGEYDFKDADLGVFDGIAGILHSTGRFNGTLDSIDVDGEATVPDFRLKSSGNRVPLSTSFSVMVDGTNGNTILKPVIGKLGITEFKTSGGVIKREKHGGHGINLDVTMPKGNLRDLLTLAMKGPPFMEGTIALQTKIEIPPLSAKVSRKLLLDGRFQITHAKFLRSKIQNQIDTFSRRGQGKPEDEQIVEVPSGLAGTFKLANEVISFRSLSFDVPGAGVDLAGSYNIRDDDIDFHGTLSLQAKVSETMSGWKRWVLKPVDPFFSKQGAGTLLHIQVGGTSKDPKFGLDHGNKKKEAPPVMRAKPTPAR